MFDSDTLSITKTEMSKSFNYISNKSIVFFFDKSHNLSWEDNLIFQSSPNKTNN